MRGRILAILVFAAACASQPPTPGWGTYEAQRDVSPYCRLVHGDGATEPWIAQTSVRTLRHPETGATVTIVSMVHGALPTYYRSIEIDLQNADIVLAEGNGGQPPGKLLPDDQLPAEGLWVRRQGRVGVRLLGLEGQIDWEERVVDTRWTLADMDTKQLVAEMGTLEFLDPEAKAQVEALETLLAGSPTPEDLKEARKGVERSTMNGIAHPDMPRREYELQLRREEVMWRIVKEHLTSGKFRRAAIVYGAWHGPAIEAKLVGELGYRLESAAWHDAIVFDVPSGD